MPNSPETRAAITYLVRTRERNKVVAHTLADRRTGSVVETERKIHSYVLNIFLISKGSSWIIEEYKEIKILILMQYFSSDQS